MAHVIGDILQSVGVCVSAALIWGLNDRWLGTLACSRTLTTVAFSFFSHALSLRLRADENGISYWVPLRSDLHLPLLHPRHVVHHGYRP